MSEEIERVVSELIGKYPEIRTSLDSLAHFAKLAEEHARTCHYILLLEDFANYKTSLNSVLGASKHAEDVLRLINADRLFRSRIIDMLRDKCGCRY